MGVSGWMFILVPAYPGSPGQKAVKRLCVCVYVPFNDISCPNHSKQNSWKSPGTMHGSESVNTMPLCEMQGTSPE